MLPPFQAWEKFGQKNISKFGVVYHSGSPSTRQCNSARAYPDSITDQDKKTAG